MADEQAANLKKKLVVDEDIIKNHGMNTNSVQIARWGDEYYISILVAKFPVHFLHNYHPKKVTFCMEFAKKNI